MTNSDTGAGQTRFRRLIWMPRGPVGMVLFVVAIAAIAFLLLLLSVVLLTVAIAAGIGLALYQSVRHAIDGKRDSGFGSARLRRERGAVPARPLEQYLSDIEEYDHLTSRVLRIDFDALAAVSSWRGRRQLGALVQRTDELRDSTIAVERAVSQDATELAEAARPGLWELVVAVTELQRYVHDLLAFPRTRGRGAQFRELQTLAERRDDIGRRRDGLVRRLQQTDLRAGSAAGAGSEQL